MSLNMYSIMHESFNTCNCELLIALFYHYKNKMSILQNVYGKNPVSCITGQPDVGIYVM